MPTHEQHILRILSEATEPLLLSDITDRLNIELGTGSPYTKTEIVKRLQALEEVTQLRDGRWTLDAEAMTRTHWEGASMAVSFADDVRSLFRDKPDIDGMKEYGLDLSSYEDVRAQAGAIHALLESGSMPCDGPWPKERIKLFKQWMDEGMAP